MYKALVTTNKSYLEFPRSIEHDEHLDVGDTLHVAGEAMTVLAVRPADNVDGHDYIIVVEGRYDAAQP